MRKYFEICSGTKAILGTLASVLILMMVVFPALPIGGESLDGRFGYTHSEAVTALESYGESGRRVYAWGSMTLDLLLPLLYASFMVGLIYRFRPAERWWMLAYLPLGVALLDLGENVQVVLMLTGYPNISVGQVAAASLFTSLKVVTFFLCLALGIVLAVVAGIRRAR
ncbi:MAG: hypothetical protein OXI38_14750 [Bacteroidota bacterium]|nr:hypothetical protein [Bacteroidota bacterium]